MDEEIARDVLLTGDQAVLVLAVAAASALNVLYVGETRSGSARSWRRFDYRIAAPDSSEEPLGWSRGYGLSANGRG